jgi:hypothetical protein
MRLCAALFFVATVSACHRVREVHGVYIGQDGYGMFFPCDDPKLLVVVQDSALAAKYRSIVTAHEPVFVRLRGIQGHSGSPKGGGQWLFEVRQILEVRPRAAGECPGVAQPIAPKVIMRPVELDSSIGMR